MSRPSVLLSRRWPDSVERHLQDRFDTTLNSADQALSAVELIDALETHDVVCPTVTDVINGDLLRRASRLPKALCNFGAGVNHIDLDACREMGVIVTNTPDVLTESTADIALLLMLATARRAGEGERLLRGGDWTGWRPTDLLGTDVVGKTLGLVGFGRIAQAVARRAHHGFGMRILYQSRSRRPLGEEAATDACFKPDLEHLLREADFVSLHCPGGPETHHLLDAGRLSQMKPSAILINTARGAVVDEAALVVALATGVIAGAGLDVYEREPSVHEGLLHLQNAVLLPHLGSGTLETRTAMGMRAVENLEQVLANAPPRDRVV